MKTFFLLLPLSLWSVLGSTQVEWSLLPEGNYAYRPDEVLAGPDGSLYVLAVSRQAVEYSPDGGTTWININPDADINVVDNIAQFELGADGTLALVVGNDVWRLPFQTNEWEHFPGQAGLSMTVTPAGTIVVNKNTGVDYLPLDESVWQSGLSGQSVGPGRLRALGDGRLIIAWQNRIRRLSLADDTVEEVFTNAVDFDQMNVRSGGEIYAVADNVLHFSGNGGDGWSVLPTTPDMLFDRIDFGGDGRLYLSREDSYDPLHFTSTDGGQNWLPSTSLLERTFSIPRTAVLTDESEVFFSDGYCGWSLFIKTADDGETYTDLSKSFRYSTIRTFANPADGLIFLSGCNLDVQYSTDDGVSWDNYPRPTAYPMTFVKAGPSEGLIAITRGNELLRSINLGVDWEAITPPGSTNGLLTNAVMLDNDHILVLQVNPRVTYYTSDGGQSWTSTSTPDYTKHLVVHPSGYFFGYDAYADGWDPSPIQRFNPVTRAWELTNIPELGEGLKELHVTPQGLLFAYTEGYLSPSPKLLVSNDLGETFDFITQIPLREDRILLDPFTIVSDQEGRLFMVDRDRVLWRSENNGNDWAVHYAPSAPEAIVPWFNVYIDRSNYLYAQSLGLYRSAEPTFYPADVIGHLWLDFDAACTEQDVDDPNVSGALVRATNTGDQQAYYAYSNAAGDYQLNVPVGEYLVDLVDYNPLYEPCSDPIVVAAAEGQPITNDLAFSPSLECPWLTATVSTPFLRRCFSNDYQVSVCNQGTIAAEASTVTVLLDEYFLFESADIAPVSQNGLEYVFPIDPLAVGACQTFTLTVTLSCEAELGEKHCMTAIVPVLDDCLPEDTPDIYQECQLNIGSYDPNDKRVFVAGEEVEDYLIPGTEALSYHIRFQNTGTDTAFTVVVEDVLPPQLDAASFVFESSSHPCETDFATEDDGRTKVRFIFNDILLVDSTTNEPASHGFVKFSLAVDDSLEMGEAIDNFADIFFDFNDAIRTDTAALVYDFPVKLNVEPSAGIELSIYPNPFTDRVYFRCDQLPAQTVWWECYDTHGRRLARERVVTPSWTWRTDGLPAGIYWYQLVTRRGRIGEGKLLKAKN